MTPLLLDTHVFVWLLSGNERLGKRSRKAIQAAAEAGIVGVWDWDIQRDVLTWDPVMYKLYGRSRDQFAAAYVTGRKGWF